ncbi:alpha/beta fold hydrolase [Halalkalibacter alkalisediminis]|uniref:Alpha/beta fold hydrolase n=1 Tax=Halalkalibacter alkalisediminis TaxID=935616 RepID=A0ABV6NBF6_9BACI|nr:alpha/beta hydrolase [Halalkalibacter alkalisediminis]
MEDVSKQECIQACIIKIQTESLLYGHSSPHMKKYTDFYKLPVHICKHEYGYVDAVGYKLFVQRFCPSKPLSTVFLLHGYLDHVGSFATAIHFLVENQYEVIGYDLPGHGLSSGKRATISKFEDYLATLQVVYDVVVQKSTNHPLLVAHSTGAMIALEYAKRTKENFQKMAFVAPLFQPHLWKLSRLGLILTTPFLQSLTRVFQKNSSDQSYLLFTEKDPLQEKRLPVSWLHALNAWIRKNKRSRTENLSFLMIQGNRDKTVDTRYGFKQVRSLYPNSSIVLIDKGHHQLLNECAVIREQTFSILLRYFKKEDKNEVLS